MGSFNPMNIAGDLVGGFLQKDSADTATRAQKSIAANELALARETNAQREKLAREASTMAQFKPYALTTGLGTFGVDASGNTTMQLSPQQQAYEGLLNQQAMQYLSLPTMVDPQGLFGQLQAMRNPEIERQRLGLENRLAAQGRLGVNTSMFGGTPEALAMEKAIQEQLSADAYNSMINANQLTGQNLGLQETALGMSYKPIGALQSQAQLGMGIGGQYNQANQNAAGLLAGTQVQGLTGFNQGLMNAADITAASNSAMAGLFGKAASSAGQALGDWWNGSNTANTYGTNVGSDQTRMLAEQDRGLW